MLVSIGAIAVTQGLQPFVVDSDDAVAILAQCVTTLGQVRGGCVTCL